jgi:hypothetical protein
LASPAAGKWFSWESYLFEMSSPSQPVFFLAPEVFHVCFNLAAARLAAPFDRDQTAGQTPRMRSVTVPDYAACCLALDAFILARVIAIVHVGFTYILHARQTVSHRAVIDASPAVFHACVLAFVHMETAAVAVLQTLDEILMAVRVPVPLASMNKECKDGHESQISHGRLRSLDNVLA